MPAFRARRAVARHQSAVRHYAGAYARAEGDGHAVFCAPTRSEQRLAEGCAVGVVAYRDPVRAEGFFEHGDYGRHAEIDVATVAHGTRRVVDRTRRTYAYAADVLHGQTLALEKGCDQPREIGDYLFRRSLRPRGHGFARGDDPALIDKPRFERHTAYIHADIIHSSLLARCAHENFP